MEALHANAYAEEDMRSGSVALPAVEGTDAVDMLGLPPAVEDRARVRPAVARPAASDTAAAVLSGKAAAVPAVLDKVAVG